MTTMCIIPNAFVSYGKDEKPKFKLIRFPRNKKKINSWKSYKNWYNSTLTYDVWFGYDSSSPYKRNSTKFIMKNIKW